MLYDIKTNYETQIFIEKYLDEKGYPSKNPTHIETMWDMINIDFKSPGVNSEDVAKYIKDYLAGKENYSKFTPTLYWTIIADWVKLIKGFTCMIWTEHNIMKYPNLEFVAHHPNYKVIHGYELQMVHELICLCQPCHSHFHNRLLFGEEKMFTIVVHNKEDIFKTPIITEKYIAYQISVLNYLVDTKNFRIKV